MKPKNPASFLLSLSLTCLTIGLISLNAYAQSNTKVEAQTRAAIEKMLAPNLGKGAKIDSITKTPYSGLYEVRLGNEIIYTDEKAQYLFIGSILNAQGSVNYTKQRIDEIEQIKFSDLPLELAMKTVKGNGKRIIATFEDPNCGPCKRLRQNLQEVDNVTIYTFLYNVITDESAAQSKNIWCSADKNKAWDEWMLNKKPAPVAAASCVFQNEKILALGHKLHVKSTPNIFFIDGTRAAGALDVKALEERFAKIKIDQPLAFKK
jgi:thiol:disulfide interchange protein DsbC